MFKPERRFCLFLKLEINRNKPKKPSNNLQK